MTYSALLSDRLGRMVDEYVIEEIQQLEEDAEDCREYKRRLQIAVDKLVDAGMVDNTPQAKYRFIHGS